MFFAFYITQNIIHITYILSAPVEPEHKFSVTTKTIYFPHFFTIHRTPASLLFPHPTCPFLSFSTYFMQIRCWGHGAKLFAAWLTVNFPFWQALLHCLLPVCHCPFIAHQPLLSPWTIQLCSPSSTRPCVPLCLSVSVSCVSPSSLSLLLSSSSSLWSSECCAFYDCPYTESSLSPGQVDRPWSDTMNILSARPAPPFLSFPTWIDWMMDGLEDIYCLCVWGVGLSGIHIHVCATKWSYPQLQCICGLTIDSWCYRLHLKQAEWKNAFKPRACFCFERCWRSMMKQLFCPQLASVPYEQWRFPKRCVFVMCVLLLRNAYPVAGLPRWCLYWLALRTSATFYSRCFILEHMSLSLVKLWKPGPIWPALKVRPDKHKS